MMVVENKPTRKDELREAVIEIELNIELPASQGKKGDTNKKFGQVVIKTL